MARVVVSMPYRSARALALACTLSLAAAAAEAQEFGRITGRVTETESSTGLAGAQVVVVGTSYGATTGENGRYVIARVPAGTHSIRVTYLGRQAQSQQVTVTGGVSATLDFALDIVTLEGVTVEGAIAKTQAEALSRQKEAPNITNIVASDQMGRFPDPSAPDAVQRIPGVAVERDLGEGRYIQIRGGSAQNTQVTVNGEQVPSPESELRQIALDAVPVDVLEAIEVAKAITPDMDAEAIGGSVNLVTRKAPEVRTMSVEAAGGFAPIRDRFAGSGSATFGDRTGDKRFGYLLGGSYSRRHFGADDLEPEYDIGSLGPSDDVLAGLEVRHYSVWRARIGGTAALDYRLSPSSNLFLSSLYSELQDEEQRRRVIHGLEDDELEFVHKNRLEKQKTFNLAVGGDHLFGSGGSVDYRAAYTRSEQDTPYDIEVGFLQENVGFSPDISDPDHPQTNPDPGTIDGTYIFDEATPGISYTKDRDWAGTINFRLPFAFGSSSAGAIKFGGKYRDKHKTQNVTELEYELASGANDIVLGQDIGRPFSNSDYEPGTYPFPSSVTTRGEIRNFVPRFGSMLEVEQNMEAETNDYDIAEKTAAGFVMAELNITPQLLLLPGVRYEHTRFEGRGFEWDSEDETLTPVSADNSYGRFFPMVHLRYRLGSETNIRAAFTSAIARPNFIQLVPFRVRDDEDLTLGNPDLDPTTSRNYDLLVEHYDRRIGVLSAGVFYKQLDKPIFPFVEDNTLGGETTQPRNIDSGKIFGLEVAVQQQLRFLPAPLDGLGIYANYTWTDSEAELPGGRTSRLPGQAEHIFNAALSYEKGRFSGQVSTNYHGDYILEFGGDSGDADELEEDIFLDSHFQLDATASYLITPRAQLFVELVNLTNEPLRTFQFHQNRPRQIEYYRSWFEVGFRVRP